MKVEKVPDSTYDMIGGLDQQIKEIKEVLCLTFFQCQELDAFIYPCITRVLPFRVHVSIYLYFSVASCIRKISLVFEPNVCD